MQHYSLSLVRCGLHEILKQYLLIRAAFDHSKIKIILKIFFLIISPLCATPLPAGSLLPPNVTVVPTARTALLTWVPLFTLLPLTNYIVNISLGSDVVATEILPPDILYYSAMGLIPTLQYSASVVAVSPAGVSVATVRPFTTLEDGTLLTV